MADVKNRKAEPQQKIKNIMSTFENGGEQQNGIEKNIDVEKPLSIPGGTKKLREEYEKKNEPAKQPEVVRKATSAKHAESKADAGNVKADVAVVEASAANEQSAAVADEARTTAENDTPQSQPAVTSVAPEEPSPPAVEPSSTSAASVETAAPPRREESVKGKVLIVYSDPDRNGFNGSMLDATIAEMGKNGYDVIISDLYRMGFNPLPSRNDAGSAAAAASTYDSAMLAGCAAGSLAPDVLAEQAKVTAADLVVFISPFHFSGFSPMLQGYLTRVLSQGFIGDMNKMEMFDNGKMKGKKALLCFPTPVCGSSLSRRSLFGDIEVFLWPIQNGALRMAGFEVLAPQISYNAGQGDDGDDQANVSAWKSRLSSIFNEEGLEFVPLSQFDAKDHLQIPEKSADQTDVGFSVGQNLGKGFPPGGMLGGMDEVDSGGSYDISN